jgi:hypothetical protein
VIDADRRSVLLRAQRNALLFQNDHEVAIPANSVPESGSPLGRLPWNAGICRVKVELELADAAVLSGVVNCDRIYAG